MSEGISQTTNEIAVQAAHLSDRLLDDIRRRRLVEGDRYLTTEQARAEFQVRKATANLAMQMLAQRKVLVRRRRRGTFVGPAGGVKAVPKVTTMYVVDTEDRPHRYPSAQTTMEMIRRKLPGVSVHFNSLPADRPVDFVRDLLRHAKEAGNMVGFLLVSCPRDVYRYFAETELPAVVLSDVYDDSDRLPSIDGDMTTAGRILIDHLVGGGHEKIALLTFANWRPTASN